MATTSVLEAIKVIDLVEIIPKYEGESAKLDGFIGTVEQVLNLIKGEERSNIGVIALGAIRSKIVGAADKVLDLDDSELNWDQIKKILITHFKDKRSEQDLIMELTHIKEKKLELEALYTKVMTLKKALVSQAKSKEQGMLLRGEKTKWYEDMALNAFVSALKGPIGVTIRNMGVTNIAKAYEITCREKNLGTLEEVEVEAKGQVLTEPQGKEVKETPKQEPGRQDNSVPESQTGTWAQYRPDSFNQGETSNYSRPYRNYQNRNDNRNDNWNNNRNYGQNNRDRQWYGNNRYNNRPREGQRAIQAAGDAEGSGQTRMSRNSNYSGQSYNSNNSRQSNNSANTRRSYNSTNNAERGGNQPATSGQLHNIQEDDVVKDHDSGEEVRDPDITRRRTGSTNQLRPC
nr:putative uncharacterized protein DDB_G0286901 [Drosophila suzukii]